MLELIVSIFLGTLLLLVILLLIWELIATYPVWKQFEGVYLTEPAALPLKDKGNSKMQKVLLLVIAVAGLICLMACCLAQKQREGNGSLQVKKETATTDVPTKRLTASSADSAAFFRLVLKWQDGKLYGNSTITFAAGAVQRFADCRYYLLDNDGFLIKVVYLSSNDFLSSTGPDGNVHNLLNKFNTEISIDDYLKIEKLQVVFDGKIQTEK